MLFPETGNLQIQRDVFLFSNEVKALFSHIHFDVYTPCIFENLETFSTCPNLCN